MIGSKLKKYRQDLKVTGETLSNLAGIKRSWLSQIENEKKYPPVDTFMNLIEAIAKVSPLTEENAEFVITENSYQEFKSLLKITFFHNSESDDDYNENQIVEENVMVEAYAIDDNVRIDINFEIKKPRIELVTDEDIDKQLRYFYFSSHKDEYIRKENILGLDNIQDYNELPLALQLDEVRTNLYNWWYNHILKDFYDTFNTNIEITNEELTIFGALMSIVNPDGTFTPYNSDDITNIPKSLLNEKQVTFDISYIKDKNLRLTLDGKPLSNTEIEMLDVSLSAIRYNRQSK